MLSAKLELWGGARIIASFYAHVGFYDAPIIDEDDFDEEAARMMSQGARGLQRQYGRGRNRRRRRTGVNARCDADLRAGPSAYAP